MLTPDPVATVRERDTGDNHSWSDRTALAWAKVNLPRGVLRPSMRGKRLLLPSPYFRARRSMNRVMKAPEHNLHLTETNPTETNFRFCSATTSALRRAQITASGQLAARSVLSGFL